MRLSASAIITRNLIGQYISRLDRAEVSMTVAEAIVDEAKKSMHPGFGTPSAPGTPPNIQSGELIGSIQAVDLGNGKAQVQVNAPYAGELEFGTAKAAARPFLMPAIARVQGNAEKIIVVKLDGMGFDE